jgi:hypothetical protein
MLCSALHAELNLIVLVISLLYSAPCGYKRDLALLPESLCITAASAVIVCGDCKDTHILLFVLIWGTCTWHSRETTAVKVILHKHARNRAVPQTI